MIYEYDKIDDVLYVGFYFKNPPGLVLHKTWENEKNIIPNFQNWMEDYSKQASL
jgi:hypothetical protein